MTQARSRGIPRAAQCSNNHFELFGLQQVYHPFIDKPEPSPIYCERFLYKVVRHPLQLGLLTGMWFAPTMSVTHSMLSAMMTIYILIGLHFEEKDLAAMLGQDYLNYRQRVRMLDPIPR
jgi:protein-S-isoprenylcysteine O-methyltransferase Ste14